MSVKKVVVDTNIIVSSFLAGGTPQKILHGWITGQFQAVTSRELCEEVNAVCKRIK